MPGTQPPRRSRILVADDTDSIRALFHKLLTADVPHAVDNGRTRTIALAIVLVCALLVTAVVRLGG